METKTITKIITSYFRCFKAISRKIELSITLIFFWFPDILSFLESTVLYNIIISPNKCVVDVLQYVNQINAVNMKFGIILNI